MQTESDSLEQGTLRALREAAGVTQEELAARLGRRQPALSRLERQMDVRMSTLREYVAGLGGELELIARVGALRTRLRQFDAAGGATDGALPSAAPPTLAYVRSRRADILRVAEEHGAYNVRVFGSVVRGDAAAESDIDLLVDMEEGRGLFDLSDVIHELEDALGRKVDLVTDRSLHWYVRDRILEEAVPL
jgi:predicted nucleotidyltransferase